MTGAAVTVTDRATYSAVVSPEQAVAYCRRVLPKWIERPATSSVYWFVFDNPKGTNCEDSIVMVPAMSGSEGYQRRMAVLCESLVSLGFASLPSDVLRAMAQEEVGK